MDSLQLLPILHPLTHIQMVLTIPPLLLHYLFRLQFWDFLSDILNCLLKGNIPTETMSNLPVLPPATATATRLEAATTWGFSPDSRIYILYLLPDVKFYIILIFKDLIII